MPEPNMKQTSLFLKSGQFEKLQELSRITGAPVAELIRRAVDVYLDLRKKDFSKEAI
jgi:predicted DNA-binding protein